MKIKRYLVFAFEVYYPGGGWTDFIDSFDDIVSAFECADSHKYPNKEVVDLKTGEEIYKYPKERMK